MDRRWLEKKSREPERKQLGTMQAVGEKCTEYDVGVDVEMQQQSHRVCIVQYSTEENRHG